MAPSEFLVSNFYHAVSGYCLIGSVVLLGRLAVLRKNGQNTYGLIDMLMSVSAFCLCEMVWGLCASGLIPSGLVFIRVLNSLKLLLASFVGYSWFMSVETYINNRLIETLWFRLLCMLPVMVVVSMIVINIPSSTDNPDQYGLFFFRYAWIPSVITVCVIMYYLASSTHLFVLMVGSNDDKLITNYLYLILFSVIPTVGASLYNLYPTDPYLPMGLLIAVVIQYIYHVSVENENRIVNVHSAKLQVQSHIYETLYNDYLYIGLANIETGENTVYKVDDSLKNLVTNTSTTEGLKAIVDNLSKFMPDDRDRFIRAMNVEKLRKTLEKNDVFFINYKLMTLKGMKYFQTKVIKDNSDPSGNTVIVSVQSVDESTREEMKHKEILEKARQKAESASMAKTNFLSRMSHDIRTPINGIVGMTEIAKRQISDKKKVNDCLDRIAESSEHLKALVNDVLDMSCIESNTVKIASEPFELSDLLQKCENIVLGHTGDRSLTFVNDFDKIDHDHLIGDELHLRQILINIIGNAVKFTPDGGTITVRTRETRHTKKRAYIKFEIEDTGRGMSEEFLSKIWEPFAQENNDKSRTEYKGTGLGMPITKNFVEMMGGKIDVKSVLGKGTTFTVSLWIDINEEVKTKSAMSSEQFNIKGKRILVVEDNEINREIIVSLLEDEGAEIFCAGDGNVAVDIFVSNKENFFDAILMDVMMPVMDGLEATKCIRSLSRNDSKTVPIIAMTAMAFQEDKEKAYDAGMNGYIAKPINIAEVINVISKLTNAK